MANHLGRMPLGTNVTQLNRANCVGIMLRAFQSNDVVKALIFMPSATDKFNFFHHARADLTNNPASLLDAVSALTNIRSSGRRSARRCCSCTPQEEGLEP